MACIKPFEGVLYNPLIIRDLQTVVAPPYDVISESMQDHFYSLNEYNIIRLILGKQTENDTSRDNRYTRAHSFMKDWLKNNVIKQDHSPCLYIYRQIYLHEGKKKVRTGFISLMKIEDPRKSGVLPHEYTLAKPKIDRFNLIKKVHGNLSPIFSLYYDKNCFISKLLKESIKKEHTPLFNIDIEGVTHQLWRLSDKKIIARIKNKMKEKRIVIADGHHRYEVALTYRDFIRKKGRKGDNKSSDYVMMYFTNLKETGNVTILSTHRLLKDIGNMNKKGLRDKLESFFDITNCDKLEDVMRFLDADKKMPRFGIYLGGKRYLLISLKKNINISDVIKEEKSSQWKRLDVTILHNLIINNILCLKDSEDNVKYVRNPEHVVELVDSGNYGMAFFLNPTKPKQVKEVAERGNMMPQKSTYFYPKLLTGLVLNKF